MMLTDHQKAICIDALEHRQLYFEREYRGVSSGSALECQMSEKISEYIDCKKTLGIRTPSNDVELAQATVKYLHAMVEQRKYDSPYRR